MTLILLLITTVLAMGTWFSDSLVLAIALPVVTLFFWVVNETMAVTVFNHRYGSHGAYKIKSRRFLKYWLWWSRSGMVKYWEWIKNHVWHHGHTDTELDSYTPNATNRLTHMPPLPKLRFFGKFWLNGKSYYLTTLMFAQYPELWSDFVATDEEAAKAQARLDELEWARPVYSDVWRGMRFNLGIFLVVSSPLALYVGGWLSLPMYAGLPWLMVGIKVYIYLVGGYIINYYGHLAKGSQHQSNIPWKLMVLTLWMFGEGWHELHHDAPYSARLHEKWDPGWWVIQSAWERGWVTNVVIAERVVPTDRVYTLVNLTERYSSDESNQIAA